MDTPDYESRLQARLAVEAAKVKTEPGATKGKAKRKLEPQFSPAADTVFRCTSDETMTKIIGEIQKTKIGQLLSSKDGWKNKDAGGEGVYPDGHRWSLVEILGKDLTGQLVNEVESSFSKHMDQKFTILPNAEEGTVNYSTVGNPQLIAWGRKMPRCHADNGQSNCFSAIINVCQQKEVLVFPELTFPNVADVKSAQDAQAIEEEFNRMLDEAQMLAQIERNGTVNADNAEVGSYTVFPSNTVHVGHPTPSSFRCAVTGLTRRTVIFLPLVPAREAEALTNNPDYNTEEPCGNRRKFGFPDCDTLFSEVRACMKSTSQKPSGQGGGRRRQRKGERAVKDEHASQPAPPRRSSRSSTTRSSTSAKEVVDLSKDDGDRSEDDSSLPSIPKVQDDTSKAHYELGAEVMTIGNFSVHKSLTQKKTRAVLKPGVMVTLKGSDVKTPVQIVAVGTICLPGVKPGSRGGENIKAAAVLKHNKIFGVVSALQVIHTNQKSRFSKTQAEAATNWISEQKKLGKPRSVKEIIHKFGLDKTDTSSAESEEETASEEEDPGPKEQPRKRHKAQPAVASDKKKGEPGHKQPRKRRKGEPAVASDKNKGEPGAQATLPSDKNKEEPGVPVATSQQAQLVNELVAQLAAAKKRQEEESEEPEVIVVQEAPTGGGSETENMIAALRLQLSKTEETLRQKEVDQREDKAMLWTCVGATVAAAAGPPSRPPQTPVPPPGAQLPQQPVY